MEYLSEFIAGALIHLLAVVSPGPDFAMVTRNSLVYSRRTGIYSALGLGFGISVHVIYSLVGIGLIISQSILLFSIIKFLGAAYLIFIGFKALRTEKTASADNAFIKKDDLKPFSAVKMGFMTNVLNPKATIFFLSLFTQVIDPLTPLFIQVLYGLEMSIMTFVWFSFVALVFSNSYFKNKFSSVQHYFERVFGVILIALGLKVALSSTK